MTIFPNLSLKALINTEPGELVWYHHGSEHLALVSMGEQTHSDQKLLILLTNSDRPSEAPLYVNARDDRKVLSCGKEYQIKISAELESIDLRAVRYHNENGVIWVSGDQMLLRVWALDRNGLLDPVFYNVATGFAEGQPQPYDVAIVGAWDIFLHSSDGSCEETPLVRFKAHSAK